MGARTHQRGAPCPDHSTRYATGIPKQHPQSRPTPQTAKRHSPTDSAAPNEARAFTRSSFATAEARHRQNGMPRNATVGRTILSDRPNVAGHHAPRTRCPLSHRQSQSSRGPTCGLPSGPPAQMPADPERQPQPFRPGSLWILLHQSPLSFYGYVLNSVSSSTLKPAAISKNRRRTVSA